MKKLTRIAAAGLAGALLLAPGVALADEESEAYTTTNTPAIASGLTIFGLSYGAAVVAAATSDNEADERMFVPVIGPWLTLADRPDCPVEQQECDSQTTQKILIGADGVLQAAGVITAVYGLLTPRTVVTDDDDYTVVPVSVAGGGPGLLLSGKF